MLRERESGIDTIQKVIGQSVVSTVPAPKTDSAPETEDYQTLVLFLIHDLEGPLAAMQTLLRLLGRGRFDLSTKLHAQLLQSTQTAMERVRLIISDLLNVSRLEQGSLPVVWDDFLLRDVIDECEALVRIAAAERDVRISISDSDRLLRVHSDRKLLARVLDNLLFNAIRHSQWRQCAVGRRRATGNGRDSNNQRGRGLRGYRSPGAI